MTSDKGKAFWLGLFVILAVCTTAWLFLFLKPSIGDGKETLKIRFTNIEGVSIGTRVTFSGKPVGRVTAIDELFDARSTKPDRTGTFYFYEVVAKVDSKVKIYNYDEIVLTTQGLLGEKSIEIIPRAAPAGEKSAHEVTSNVLYARSTDQIQAAIDNLNHVLTQVSDFIGENSPLVERTLLSVENAANSVDEMIEEVLEENLPRQVVVAADAIASAMHKGEEVFCLIKDHQLVERLAGATTSIEELADKLVSGQGTIGRLINSDALYFQLSSTLNTLETVLSDISHYGLLFQYDKKWQRQRAAKMKRMEQLCSPEDFDHYMNREMSEIALCLDRVSKALKKLECQEASTCDLDFLDSFQAIIGRVQDLLRSLERYDETMQRCSDG